MASHCNTPQHTAARMQHNKGWLHLTSHGWVLYGQDIKQGNSSRLHACKLIFFGKHSTMFTKVAMRLMLLLLLRKK